MCKTIAFLLIFTTLAESLEAQRRRTRTSNADRQERQEQNDLSQWYAISIGTLGFGSGFSISGKFSYALRFKERFSVGAYGKTFYDLVNVINGPDIGLFSYGGGAFTRINITNDIFLQGEYGYGSFETFEPNTLRQFRENHLYPSVGGGYKTGYGDWTYGFHLQLPLDDRVRDFVSLEYWIDFNYNF